MSELNDAQQALAAHLKANVNKIDPLAAVVPAFPLAWAGYVWPGPDWITPEDDQTFCGGRSVGLVLDLVAGIDDLEHSQVWLADRVDEVWLATASAGVEVAPDQRTFPERADRPIIVRVDQGHELLVVRIEFTRFTLENA